MSISADHRPRFRRVPVAAIELTDRDIEIIRTVGKFRFVRSTHLMQLTGSAYKPLMRRLQLLYHNHYLDRPRAQIDQYAVGGSKPMVYALGNRGADILAQHDGQRRAKVDWTAKNRDTGRVFIEHTLLIADVMIALEIACRGRDDVRLIDGDDLLHEFPTPTQRARNPFRMDVRIVHEGSAADVGLVPDRIFALEFPQLAQRSYFFLEADRGTMPVVRTGLEQTSILRKLLAYHQAWKQEIAARRFGFRNFRALFVTRGSERARTMFDAGRMATPTPGSRLFLFSDASTILSDDVLNAPIRNGRDELVRLFD